MYNYRSFMSIFCNFTFPVFISAYYRFVVLFFNCMLTFGTYFCFDMPSVLQDDFQQKVSSAPPSKNAVSANIKHSRYFH